MTHATRCPKCDVTWQETQSIYQTFLGRFNNDPIKARESSEMYGCTEESPKYFGKNVTGIEVQGKYDGVSFWKCIPCATVFDRWTMEEATIDKYC